MTITRIKTSLRRPLVTPVLEVIKLHSPIQADASKIRRGGHGLSLSHEPTTMDTIMTEQIERDTFEHLVDLAALELDEEEAEYLRQELNNQLTAIQELAAIPLKAGTNPTSHGVPYTSETRPALREDDWISCPNPEEILAQAPELEEEYIVVPDIPHTELD